jgi:hypothetical protein
MGINKQVSLVDDELLNVLKNEYPLILRSAKEIHSDLSEDTNPLMLLMAMDKVITKRCTLAFPCIPPSRIINRVVLDAMERNVEEYFKASYKQEEKKLCLIGEEDTPNEHCVYSIHYEKKYLFGVAGKMTRTTYLNMKVEKTDILEADSWEEDFQIIYPKLQEAGWKRFTIGANQKDTDSLWLRQHVRDVIFKFIDNPIVTGTVDEFHNYIQTWLKQSQQDSLFVLGIYCAKYIDYLAYRERQYKSLTGAMDIVMFFRKSLYTIDWDKPQPMLLKQKPSSPL